MSKGEPDLSPASVTAKIRAMVGDPDLELSIRSTSVWYVNQAYATTYSVGRVFCGGDAVHRHPPSSGLGSNTCIQDAFNLAWKLAFVLRGEAGPGLLASYSPERAPVGRQIVMRANQSRLDYAPLNRCFRVAGDEDPVAAGLRRLRDPGPEGAAIREEMVEALELKNTEFNAQGIESNQRYESSAVQAEPGAAAEEWKRDPQLYLQATTRPGAKLPHVWLVNSQGKRVSTLDLVGKGRMTLVTGLSGVAWIKAAERLGHPSLRVLVIGSADALDLYCSWARHREIAEAGALLVRPDGYVAWRQVEAVWDEASALGQLRAALASVLSVAFEAGSALLVKEAETAA
jgi:2,4-dichlorophenol 6-monooxygenase